MLGKGPMLTKHLTLWNWMAVILQKSTSQCKGKWVAVEAVPWETLFGARGVLILAFQLSGLARKSDFWTTMFSSDLSPPGYHRCDSRWNWEKHVYFYTWFSGLCCPGSSCSFDPIEPKILARPVLCVLLFRWGSYHHKSSIEHENTWETYCYDNITI